MTQPRHRFDDEQEESSRATSGATNGANPIAPTSRRVVADHLKCLFAELTSGPMPDHLLALVDQLEATDDGEVDGPATPPAHSP